MSRPTARLAKCILLSMDGGGLCPQQDSLSVEFLHVGREVRVLGTDVGDQEWKRMTDFSIWSRDLRLELGMDTVGSQVSSDGVTHKGHLSTYSLDGCCGPSVYSSSYSHISGVALLGDAVIAQLVFSRPLSLPGIKTQICITSDDPHIHTDISCFFLHAHISGESVHNFIWFYVASTKV